jgi:hypothetical protein
MSKLNLVALHKATSPRYDRDCLKCHADVLTRKTLDPQFAEVHTAMLPYTPGYDPVVGVRNTNCIWCHATVDLSPNRSAGAIRRQVDPEKCRMCHGPGSSKPFYQ